MAKPPRLFLFDGSALAYRSHFAFVKNPLRNQAGLNTSAAFGFTRELLRILDAEVPERAAVVFDVSKKTFRHERYADYKATRQQMPDEMLSCLPYVDKIVDGLGVARLGVEGYEADDVIGTLAKRGAAAGYEVFIVSGDKDFCQLVTERVKIYNPYRVGVRGVEILDPAGVKERHGVTPERFRDYLALCGDSSDNVPGVPSVGPKRALEILLQFGDLDAALADPHAFPRKGVAAKLEEFRDQALLSRELVTIEEDMPLPETLDDLQLAEPDAAALNLLFAELEFREFSGRFTVELSGDPHVHERITGAELPALIETLREAGEFVFDLETTSLDPREAEIVGIAFSHTPGQAAYIAAEESLGQSAFELFPVELDMKAHLEQLAPLFADSSVKKGGQNVKYDISVLERHGIPVKGIGFDTMLESYVLDPAANSHGLDSLALRYLGYKKISTRDVIGSGAKQRNMRDTHDDEIFPYASEDADITCRLHHLFRTKLAEDPARESLYQDVELPLLPILLAMETRGVAIDTQALKATGVEFKARLEVLAEEAYALAGEPFNLGSPKQVGGILYERLKLHEQAGVKIKKTLGGARSTNHEALEALAEVHALPRVILAHRALDKLLGTYVQALPKLINKDTGRVHTNFNQAVTSTGRLSSSDPNLQNIPIRSEEGRRIRAAFVAGEPGWLILSADYSQVELRVLAHLSEDEALCAAFHAGLDVHRSTASRVFGVELDEVTPEQRGRAKAINFGLVYGMGRNRLASDTGLTLEEAGTFIENYFRSYPGIKGYLDGSVEHARREGWVTTILGRQRSLDSIRSSRRSERANAERVALNSPVQGSAADIMKLAMLRVAARLEREKLRAHLLLQVHDELVLEVHPEDADALEALVREEMEQAYELRVPLKVDVGRGANWLEAH
ncbi:MAG: DNA polymerase I [Planctomycetes bacterium]|nr:DNA polymerase I [Planctomycetota bacterium]